MRRGSADHRLCGPRLLSNNHHARTYSSAVSKLRRPFLADRFFFITMRLLRRRTKLSEPDYVVLARSFNRAGAVHKLHLTAEPSTG